MNLKINSLQNLKFKRILNLYKNKELQKKILYEFVNEKL